MTARQRAMFERKTDTEPNSSIEQLMSLPTGYKEKVMTAEAIQKAALKSLKRKQLADEKREKDKVINDYLSTTEIMLSLFYIHTNIWYYFLKEKNNGTPIEKAGIQNIKTNAEGQSVEATSSTYHVQNNFRK